VGLLTNSVEYFSFFFPVVDVAADNMNENKNTVVTSMIATRQLSASLIISFHDSHPAAECILDYSIVFGKSIFLSNGFGNPSLTVAGISSTIADRLSTSQASPASRSHHDVT